MYELPKLAQSFINTIGVNTHIRYSDGPYWNFPLLKTLLVNSGIKLIRDSLVTNSVTRNIELARIRELGEAGIGILLIGSPELGDTPATVKTNIAALSPFVVGVENPNEWNANSGTRYNSMPFVEGAIAYQNDLYQEMKNTRRTSNLPVYGLSVFDGGQYETLCNYFGTSDVGNVHSYSGGRTPTGEFVSKPALDRDYIPWARNTSQSNSWASTETGFSGALASGNTLQNPISEIASAKYLSRILFEYYNRGSLGTYIYELFDQSASNTDTEKRFGIVRSDGTPKVSYNIIKNIISILNDNSTTPFWPRILDFTLSGPNTVSRTLLQKKNGVYFLALWNDLPVFNNTTITDILNSPVPVTITLSTSYTNINVYDPMTSSSVKTSLSNASSVVVQVPDHPIIIELKA